MRTFPNLGPVLGLAVTAALLAAWPAASQMQMRAPEFRGVFNPVVGSGAAYELYTKDGKTQQMEVTIIGKEDVAGKPGYWMEMAMGGQMYMKDLMAFDGTTMTVTRMIMQMAGQQPMEMTAMINSARGAQPSPKADFRKEGTLVGTESVTTPAGTFSCQHWKAADGSGDVWITTTVAPWGLVKSTGKDANMTLTRVITNATDHITGTPMQMPAMPGGYPQGR